MEIGCKRSLPCLFSFWSDWQPGCLLSHFHSAVRTLTHSANTGWMPKNGMHLFPQVRARLVGSRGVEPRLINKQVHFEAVNSVANTDEKRKRTTLCRASAYWWVSPISRRPSRWKRPCVQDIGTRFYGLFWEVGLNLLDVIIVNA